MTRFLLAGAIALVTITGAAMAQSPNQDSTTQETTTITQPAASPRVVLSTATTGTATQSDGDQTATSASTSADSAGNKTQTTVTNTSYPLTGMLTSTKKVTQIVNGVATETITTTNTFPASSMRPPEVTTATRTYVATGQ
jgi:hypothetical protein